MPNKTVLPRVLSDLIDVAVEDLKKVEDDPRYSFQMNTWHLPLRAQAAKPATCAVCMAGSVMAMSLRAARSRAADPASPEYAPNADQLWALNGIRTGAVEPALRWLVAGEVRPWSTAQACVIKTVTAFISERVGLPQANGDRVIGAAPWEVYTAAASALRRVGL